MKLFHIGENILFHIGENILAEGRPRRSAPARRQDKNHAASAAQSDQLYNGKVAA